MGGDVNGNKARQRKGMLLSTVAGWGKSEKFYQRDEITRLTIN